MLETILYKEGPLKNNAARIGLEQHLIKRSWDPGEVQRAREHERRCYGAGAEPGSYQEIQHRGTNPGNLTPCGAQKNEYTEAFRVNYGNLSGEGGDVHDTIHANYKGPTQAHLTARTVGGKSSQHP